MNVLYRGFGLLVGWWSGRFLLALTLIGAVALGSGSKAQAQSTEELAEVCAAFYAAMIFTNYLEDATENYAEIILDDRFGTLVEAYGLDGDNLLLFGMTTAVPGSEVETSFAYPDRIDETLETLGYCDDVHGFSPSLTRVSASGQPGVPDDLQVEMAEICASVYTGLSLSEPLKQRSPNWQAVMQDLRGNQLLDRFGLDQTAILTGAYGIAAMAEEIFAQGLDPSELIQSFSSCDRIYGFSPSLIVNADPVPVPPQDAGTAVAEQASEAQLCAALYLGLSLSATMERLAPDYVEIRDQQRWATVLGQHDLDPDAVTMQGLDFVDPQSGLMEDAARVDRAAAGLAYCDEMFGFTPVFKIEEPQAEELDLSLMTCASLYGHLALSRQSMAAMYQFDEADPYSNLFALSEAGPFWAYSNAATLPFADRREALRLRSGLSDLAFGIRVDGISGGSPWPNPGSPEAGFPEGTSSLTNLAGDPPPANRTPAFGRHITACDREHGFLPHFSFGAVEPGTPLPPPGDFACAIAFWLAGAYDPAQQADAIRRAETAVRAYHARNDTLDQGAINQQIVGIGQALGGAIEQGQLPRDWLQAEVAACTARFEE